MGYLQQIEALIANTSTDNQVKAGGDYWYQPTSGIEIETDVWSDDGGGGWIVSNTLSIHINGTLVFNDIEQKVVNYSCEEYKGNVIAEREEYLKNKLSELIALGY
jgi:hypothetical protein